MKRIAIDMDEVIADALSALINAYNMEFGETLTHHVLAGREMEDVVHPDRRTRIHAYTVADEFFRTLNVMPDSQEVLSQLSGRYEVFITTAAMQFPNSFTAKYEWLQEHFPFIPSSHVVFCGDKSIIRADYLIDDHSYHFEHFSGQGILFTSPHNLGVTRYPRVDNWRDVAAMFLSGER